MQRFDGMTDPEPQQVPLLHCTLIQIPCPDFGVQEGKGLLRLRNEGRL